ncbi:mariner Mos1 transposase [Trichonephila clavata]|uniref:Mariner Mos1 transposase n=1 Tax=Trichonephila clavata TaxID=2740835 RepID=A0A8X6KRS1_TRICU|nr:mariner Mos1 transposase [Trichonephila clavata]
MRRNTAFRRKLSLVTKHGVTIWNRKASDRVSRGNGRPPPPKKSNVGHNSSCKVMMAFFDHKGPLLVEFLKRGTTINAQRYEATLKNLRRAIISKRPGIVFPS